MTTFERTLNPPRHARQLADGITFALPTAPTANDLAIDLIAALGADTESRMTHEDHVYWLAVGKELGPAHIKALRHVAAFMAKMEEF